MIEPSDEARGLAVQIDGVYDRLTDITSAAPITETARLIDAALTEARESALPCDGGCAGMMEGPQETCSRHGRPVAEVWQIAIEAERERDEALSDVERLRRLVDENSDRLQEPHPVLERLRATVARVEALADNWKAIPYDKRTPYDEGWHDALDICETELRAALRGGDPYLEQ